MDVSEDELPTISTQPIHQSRSKPGTGQNVKKKASTDGAPARQINAAIPLQFGRRGKTKNIKFGPSDTLARVLRTMKNEGFPPNPNSDVGLGHPDSCAIKMMNSDGSIWAPSYTFQLIDLDANTARAKQALSASLAPAQPMEQEHKGTSRGRSESTLITRSGNLERRSQLGLGDGEVDNGPRVSSLKQEQEERDRSCSQGSQFDPVVRLVDGTAQEQARTNQLSENFEQFLDLGGGLDISEFSLSDMEMQIGAQGEARQPSNTSLRTSGAQRDSSGIEVYQFTKAELQRIGGLKEIMAANPEAFPCHKVKKTQKPTPYNVIAFNANANGPQCVMEAIPLPDSGTPLYQCGYCRSVKSSSSAGADGRVRIRCECGGKHKDGKARMHANWNLVKPSSQMQQMRQLSGVPENQRMGLKSSKMPANTRTVPGFGEPVVATQPTVASGIERISGGHGRISDDLLIALQDE